MTESCRDNGWWPSGDGLALLGEGIVIYCASDSVGDGNDRSTIAVGFRGSALGGGGESTLATIGGGGNSCERSMYLGSGDVGGDLCCCCAYGWRVIILGMGISSLWPELDEGEVGSGTDRDPYG